jgi:hypothetical protein
MPKRAPSPLSSRAFDPYRLPKPDVCFDLRQTLSDFETLAAARREDSVRAEGLLTCDLSGAKEFGFWLADVTAVGDFPLTGASSVYYRQLRRRVLGEVQRLAVDLGYTIREMAVFTLIHPNWYWESGALRQCRPRKLKAVMRRYYERSGIVEAAGLLFSGLHGEYDGRGYQLHYHGWAAEEKAEAVEELRGKFGFKTTATIYRPVEITDVTDFPKQLSYCLKSYWVQKIRGSCWSKKVRLPTPQHEEVLLWQAQHSAFDIMLMIGMRVMGSRLVVT